MGKRASLKPRKLILTSHLCPGDAVMLTAAVRDLHKAHPFKYITDVDTTAPDIWKHNPYITKLRWKRETFSGKHVITPQDEDADAEVIECHYPLVNKIEYKPYHFIHGYVQYLERKLKIKIPITAFKGDIHLSKEERSWISQVQEHPHELNRNFWIIMAGGKYDFTCVAAGTRVMTNHGYKKIEDVTANDLVFTEYGYRRCAGSVLMGRKKCITIVTRTSEITVSSNHRFKVLDKNCNTIWKRAHDIKPGDNIIGRYHKQNTKKQLYDIDKWFAFGFLWGDGILRKKNECTWIFSETDIKAKNRIIAWLNRNNYAWHETIREPADNRTQIDYRITTGRKRFSKNLPEYMPKGTWRNAGFPDNYFKLDIGPTRALLQGLFSSDGTIDEIGNISYTSVSQNLVSDIRRLLWKCGMLSTISSHEFTSEFGAKCIYYRVSILGKSSNQEFRKIGFYHNTKDTRLINHKYKFDRFIGIDNATAIIESFRTKKNATTFARQQGIRKPAALRQDLRKHNFIAESAISIIRELFESDHKGWNEFTNNEWYLDKVTDIKPAGLQEVYDIINSETESYISEGMVSHNCKWWDPQRYQAVVDHFLGRIKFVQCGEAHHWHPPLRGVINLIGKTNTRQFIRLVYHSVGILCPVTFAMHLAAAVPVKQGHPENRACVVIAGGREPSQWEAYPTHQFIHNCGALPCCQNGGCWKSRCQPVKDGDEKDNDLCPRPVAVGNNVIIPECMSMIRTDDVIRRIETYYDCGVGLRYFE